MLIAALSSVSSASLTLSSSESSRVEGQWASVGVVLLQWRAASCETVKFIDDREDVEVLEKREKHADLLRRFILWNSLGLQIWRTGQRGPFCFSRLDRTEKYFSILIRFRISNKNVHGWGSNALQTNGGSMHSYKWRGSAVCCNEYTISYCSYI